MLKALIVREIKRFKYAFNGIFQVFKSELHFKFHVIAVCFVIVLGLFYQITSIEWMFLVLAIGMVLVSEVINTIVEDIMDFIHIEAHPKVGMIKDMGAGAVLIASLIALVIGIMIFGPYIIGK